jgi:hypothetical protein
VVKAEPGPAAAMAAASIPAPPVDSPALLMDFRRGVRWVARFLQLALRSPARERRAEALDELRATLAPEELRRLASWVEEAAEARRADSRPSGAAA